MDLHPCLSCGACCAKYRVSFHWSETLDTSFHVPIEKTQIVNSHILCMTGTNESPYRCDQLQGELKIHVACAIYENRPSPCRDFKASYEDGHPYPRCDEARQHFGLKPLTPYDWGVGL